jgi:hypothetical protein
VTLPSIDLSGEDLTFPELAKNLKPEEFLRTQREKFEIARLRAFADRSRGKRKPERELRSMPYKARRAKMRDKLRKLRLKQDMRQFAEEIRARVDQGYSMRQLMLSHIPEIGQEVKVSEAEITAALRRREANHLWGPSASISFM